MYYYLDEDLAYLLGMIVARGEITTGENVNRISVRFISKQLIAKGVKVNFDVKKEIMLGLEKIRERLVELTSADIRTIQGHNYIDLVIRFTRNNVIWRNINAILENRTSYATLKVPSIFFHPDTPYAIKREFVKGYADVAGNLRPANRDQTGRHRVRLDCLNRVGNWEVPVSLCLLLQDHLQVPVPNIIYGHPNLNRDFREHQLNIYAEEFLQVGFYFDYKQQVLEELANINLRKFQNRIPGCPGERSLREHKPVSKEENSDKLDSRLRGNHYDAYWQICRALGCYKRPPNNVELSFEENE